MQGRGGISDPKVRPTCAFPGESCEAKAIGYFESTEGKRIPICRHHAEKVKAHLTAMRHFDQMPRGPLHPRVREARAMLNAHTSACRTCRPIGEEIGRAMASMQGRAPTKEETDTIGEFIIAHACKIGVKLYAAHGRAMLALDGGGTDGAHN